MIQHTIIGLMSRHCRAKWFFIDYTAEGGIYPRIVTLDAVACYSDWKTALTHPHRSIKETVYWEKCCAGFPPPVFRHTPRSRSRTGRSNRIRACKATSASKHTLWTRRSRRSVHSLLSSRLRLFIDAENLQAEETFDVSLRDLHGIQLLQPPWVVHLHPTRRSFDVFLWARRCHERGVGPTISKLAGHPVLPARRPHHHHAPSLCRSINSWCKIISIWHKSISIWRRGRTRWPVYCSSSGVC